jgi:hypothetical protein
VRGPGPQNWPLCGLAVSLSLLHKAWHRNSWRFENNSRFRGPPQSATANLLASAFACLIFKPSLLQLLPEKQANSFTFLYVPVSSAPTVRSPKQPSHSADEAQNWLSHSAQPDLALDHLSIKHLDFAHLPYVFSHSSTSRSILCEAEAAKHSFQYSLPHLSQPFMPWLPTITTAIHTPTTSTSR